MLAIECDWRLRKLIRANLEASGLEVQEAVSVQHGLQLIRQHRPDLILLDIDRLDGEIEPLLASLRDQLGDPPVPIVLLATEAPSRSLTEQAGVHGFVRKPFAIPALLHQVQLALAGPPADC